MTYLTPLATNGLVLSVVCCVYILLLNRAAGKRTTPSDSESVTVKTDSGKELKIMIAPKRT